jgi:hypothetical protein
MDLDHCTLPSHERLRGPRASCGMLLPYAFFDATFVNNRVHCFRLILVVFYDVAFVQPINYLCLFSTRFCLAFAKMEPLCFLRALLLCIFILLLFELSPYFLGVLFLFLNDLASFL